MNRKIFTLFIVVSLFISLPKALPAMVLKIATIAPEGAFEVVEMKKAADEIKTLTKGRVTFKFFTGGVMGNDQGVLRKIRINQLQGGAISSGSLSGYYPDSQIYALPLLFESFDEVDHVRATMDPILMKGYADNGLVTFGLAEGGFAYIMSNSPVASIPDLQQQKVWIPENDNAALEAVKAFDVNPIPLSIADVRTGLQTGMIDTVAIPPAYAIILHWHTQIKYVTRLPLLYTFGVLAINETVFNRISLDDQATVRSIMEPAFKRIDRHNRNQNDQAMAVLSDMGITSINPEPKIIRSWKERSDTIAANLVQKKILSPEILATMKELLAGYRNR